MGGDAFFGCVFTGLGFLGGVSGITSSSSITLAGLDSDSSVDGLSFFGLAADGMKMYRLNDAK